MLHTVLAFNPEPLAAIVPATLDMTLS